jgi:hypothetical protein
LVNIHAEGLQLESPKTLGIGKTYEVRLLKEFPHKISWLDLKFITRWEEQLDNGSYRTGCQLIDVAHEEKIILQQF